MVVDPVDRGVDPLARDQVAGHVLDAVLGAWLCRLSTRTLRPASRSRGDDEAAERAGAAGDQDGSMLVLMCVLPCVGHTGVVVAGLLLMTDRDRGM